MNFLILTHKEILEQECIVDNLTPEKHKIGGIEYVIYNNPIDNTKIAISKNETETMYGTLLIKLNNDNDAKHIKRHTGKDKEGNYILLYE